MLETRSINLKARVTPTEYAAIKARCARLDTNVSSYVRAMCTLPTSIEDNAVLHDASALVVIDGQGLRDLIRQIRAWGYHYNQATHALNQLVSRTWIKDDERDELLARASGNLEDINKAQKELLEIAHALKNANSIYLKRGAKG